MWTYKQSTGDMLHDGENFATAYAGRREGLNNPAMQNVEKIGPLPQGRYKIGPAYQHPRLGSVCMNLEPDAANEMFGRSDFRIHGDNAWLDHSASEGCIVLGIPWRMKIKIAVRAGENILEVVE